MDNLSIGIISAILSTLSWALCSVMFKKLGEKLDAVGMTCAKASISCLILFLILFMSGTSLYVPLNSLFKIFLSGVLGIALGDSLFFAALERLSPVTLSIILFVSPIIFSGIFGFIFLNEVPSLIAILGIFFILFGLSFLIFPIKKKDNSAKTKISGILLALLSLICTTYSIVLIKPLLLNMSTMTATMYRMLFSAIVIMIYGLISKKIFIWKNILSDINYLSKFSAVVLVATIGGFWLSLLSMKYCKIVIASSLMSIEPLFILFFMILFYKYTPKIKEYFGILITVLGIIILCVR